MLKPIFVTAATYSLMLAPASAANVPALSGSYATSLNEVCQANLNNNEVNTGETHSETAIVIFNSNTGTVMLNGTDTSGALVVMGGTPVGYSQSPISGSGAYTNTATTVTLAGQTFNVAYGPVKKGIAQSLTFSGIAAGNCALSGTSIRQ